MDDRELRKEAIKEAFREWLVEERKKTYESLGKYIANAAAIAITGALAYWILIMNGWVRH